MCVRAVPALAVLTLAMCLPVNAAAEPMTPIPKYEVFAEAQDGAGMVNGLVRCAGLVRVLKARGLMAPGDDTDTRVLARARENLVFMTAANRAVVAMDTAPYESAYAAELGALTGEGILTVQLITEDMSACGTLIQNAG